MKQPCETFIYFPFSLGRKWNCAVISILGGFAHLFLGNVPLYFWELSTLAIKCFILLSLEFNLWCESFSDIFQYSPSSMGEYQCIFKQQISMAGPRGKTRRSGWCLYLCPLQRLKEIIWVQDKIVIKGPVLAQVVINQWSLDIDKDAFYNL